MPLIHIACQVSNMEPCCLLRVRMAICLGLRSDQGQVSATESSLQIPQHVSLMLLAW